LCVGGDFAPYGAPRVQLTLLAGLDRALIEPEIYYIRDTGGMDDLDHSELNLQFGLTSQQRVRDNAPRILNTLIRLARRSDLVFSMLEGPPLYVCAIAARATCRPLASWVHNNWSAVLEHSKTWHRPVSRFFFPAAKHLICVSEGVRDDLVAFCPSIHDRTEAIPNPIPLEEDMTRSQVSPPEWAARIFSKPTILAAGRLVWQKGFDLLIRAASSARASGADFNVIILGEGPDRPDLEALAVELGIRERVFLPGYLPNPFPFYRNATAFVLSSRFEGLPTVLVEALCVGTPVIAFDCPSGPNEILSGGRFGRLVAKEDIVSLGNEIKMAIQHPDRFTIFRSMGRQHAQKYSAKPLVRRFERTLIASTAPHYQARKA
jgi:glycosyltransferase involved in cell wall biosynthesis